VTKKPGGPRPGSPEELAAEVRRVAALPPEVRRLYDEAGAEVDSADAEAVDALVESLAGMRIAHAYQRGFPAAEPYASALSAAATAAGDYGRVTTAEVVTTPDHEAAGEYLVRVLAAGPA
jgi:ribosomal protein L12E/L44/L45/RPP1/RPP2